MTESSSIALRASRRKRILALAKRLTDNLESLTLEEIDGEFYWRIVRDDLFDRLTELAGSIAPTSSARHVARYSLRHSNRSSHSSRKRFSRIPELTSSTDSSY
jgi:hypothetical protein